MPYKDIQHVATTASGGTITITNTGSTLAYNEMTFDNYGQTLSTQEKKKFRIRYGFCTECEGPPILLYHIKERNVLRWRRKKKPRYVRGECAGGICFICHPDQDPTKHLDQPQSQQQQQQQQRQQQQNQPHDDDDEHYESAYKTQQEWMSIAHTNVTKLQSAPEQLKSDKAFIWEACAASNCAALQFASEALQNDPEFVLQVCSLLRTTTTTTARHDVGDDEAKRLFSLFPSYFLNDKDFLLELCAMHPKAFLQQQQQQQFVPEEVRHLQLQKDKKFMLELCRRNGMALQFASRQLQDYKPIVQNACWNSPQALQYASERMKNDKYMIQKICSKDPSSLVWASTKLKNDKDMALAVVAVDGNALKYVSQTLKYDEDVVIAAITQTTSAIQFVPSSHSIRSKESIVSAMSKATIWQNKIKEWQASNAAMMSDNRGIAMDLVSHDSYAFQYAPDNLRADKDVVLAAVSRNPEMLKFALGGLKQDKDCWIAAGLLWNDNPQEQQQQKKNGGTSEEPSPSTVTKVVLSTKFALNETSTSSVNRFTKLLNADPFFRDGNFVIYSPNAFNKATCDPEWTRMDWPCRGTFETCRMKETLLKTGKPTSACCWRYSFRWQLEQAKKTNGFMIQVVDFDGKPELFEKSESEYSLGDGQKIESVMAGQVGAKIFRIYRPRTFTISGGQFLQEFRDNHIADLAYKVQEWYNGGCSDMKDCRIWCNEYMT